MEIYSISQARQELFKLIDTINQNHEPVYIVGKRNKAVLIAEEDYRAMIETLYIMTTPGLKESIISLNNDSLDEYSEDIDL